MINNHGLKCDINRLCGVGVGPSPFHIKNANIGRELQKTMRFVEQTNLVILFGILGNVMNNANHLGRDLRKYGRNILYFYARLLGSNEAFF